MLYSLGFCALMFFVIPVHIDKKENLAKKSQSQAKFNSFISRYNKSYSLDSEDYKARLEIFENALKTVKTMNGMRQFNESALYGLTEFSDLSPEEFSHKYLRKHHHEHKHRRNERRNDVHSIARRAIPSLPSMVDWRAKGVVTGVKDQGPCGACWAFSTVATVESMLAIKTGKLAELSVQEIIDCARNGNLGCNGGDFCSLLEWLTANQVAIEPATSYPLLLKNDVCKWKKSNPGILVAGNFTCDYLVGREDLLLQRIAEHGPVVVAVNAISWQYYLGGVIENNCPGQPELLNHAVEIVGYDLTSSIPHYIAKNSWGKRFGDGGYVKIATGSNVCGIANEVTSLDVL
ncbi:hypothetical protein GE061_000294 [Apolygus lucorum]|uniref:Cathepsin O n=1 Tax=Apolygus lucorum TaxID=248454 RepID=A0A8S9Y3Y7_APOLU|nr:hypothetical protein GE061_000294 [Apolygus lucorum]